MHEANKNCNAHDLWQREAQKPRHAYGQIKFAARRLKHVDWVGTNDGLLTFVKALQVLYFIFISTVTSF